MKALFLYGPPAVGKLTIAQALAAKTDYKLFDNHASDLAHGLFSRDQQAFGNVVKGIRRLVFE